MKKYIIALSTLLCATALHGAASQQDGPSGTGAFSFAKKIISASSYNPEKGDQACNNIEEWWKQMQKITAHTDYQFTHQELSDTAKIINKSCLGRKEILTEYSDKLTDAHKITLMEIDDIMVRMTPKLKQDFALVQSMAATTEACREIDFFKKILTLNTPRNDIALKTCHKTKNFYAQIEQITKDGRAYTIDDEDREKFIGLTSYLAEYVASVKSMPEEHATPAPSTDTTI